MKISAIIRSLCTYGIYTSLLFVLSCTDKIDSIVALPFDQGASVTVAEAQAYFEITLAQEELPVSNSVAEKEKKAKKSIRVPLWHLAKETRKDIDDGSNILTIPLVQDKHDLGLYGNRNMLVFKDKNKGNKLTYAMVEAFADKDYLKANNYKFNSKNFTGTILIHDWKEGFETGFLMKNGQPIALVKDLQELDENGVVVKTNTTNSATARKANCIITIYEKCYGTNVSGCKWYMDIFSSYLFYR